MFPEFQPLEKKNSVFTTSQERFRYQAKKFRPRSEKKYKNLYLSEKKLLKNDLLHRWNFYFQPLRMFFGQCPEIVINFNFSKNIYIYSPKMILWKSRKHFSLPRPKSFAIRSKNSRSKSENNFNILINS